MSRPQATLLIELGTEELPPKALQKLSEAFSSTLSESLNSVGLLTADAKIKAYATPRRLAVLISEVADTQEDFSQSRKGPAVAAAFNDAGEPTRAASGFAKSCGVEVADLGRDKTDQGEWLVFEQTIAGKSITQCAQEALDTAIAQLPIPRRMRWGDKSAEFVRPVHWLLALHGDSTLALATLGLNAGNTSRGHRFHHPGKVEIKHTKDYSKALEKAFVIPDHEKRRELIRQQCGALASDAGGIAVLDDALLDEVTGLVEWPVSILGQFDPILLGVPREALIASMTDHQKYFYLTDSDGDLLPAFITVSNIESTAPEKVLKGNERVLHARLFDAQFFWEQDKQHKLEDNAPRLEGLLFHIKLGSMADKTQRLISISEKIAELTGVDVAASQRAASLCKLDLVSHMVGEFASLQGTMGRYYALNDGESETIADAVEQHYWPKFAGDRLPQSGVSLALALADRMDALVGIFATGEKPSGVKDPYALRRAALGVLRMLIENDMDIRLQSLIEITVDAYQDTPNISIRPNEEIQAQIKQFVHDRLRAYYTGKGFDIHTFNAIAEVHPAYASDFDRRIRAISDFFKSEKSAATSLAAANKRIANILKQNKVDSIGYDSDLFQEEAERNLATALEALGESTQAAFDSQQYARGLTELASLENPVNIFFEEVRVMDDDESLRDNRLGLLGTLRDLFLQVADISHLNVDKDA
jgi:glycyl-tRNA synthetase beta chain